MKAFLFFKIGNQPKIFALKYFRKENFMNYVDITGRLREKIDENFRYLEYELPYMKEPDEGQSKIVVSYWTKQPNSRLIQLADHTRVILHGHLEPNEKFGTILVVEHLESLH